MNYFYSKNSIDNLKEQADIVDVIGRVVNLKKAGAYYKGVCPFHSEKTPSFHVSETRQYFTCFGCGAKGDVIEFTKKFYNLDFTEAVEKLAEQTGITLEKQGKVDDSLQEYYEANRLAARYFYHCYTKEPNPGADYMRKRGVSPDVLRKFGIGYADGEWDSLTKYLLSKGVSDKILKELGLASVSQKSGRLFDRFRNRVIFPILNPSGKVIGFGGRALDPGANAKYLNSPESRIFQKKNNLYGLSQTKGAVRKEGSIILVEGYMDAISLYQYGIENVAASCGTALTENQAKLIRRYAKNVILSYDADQAGRNAALRGIEILRDAGLNMKVLHVTDGKDPDEFVKSNGADAYLQLITAAPGYADYKLEAAKKKWDITGREGRISYIRDAVQIIGGLDPVEQEEYKKLLANEMDISVLAIEKELARGNAMESPAPRRDERGRQNEGNQTPPEIPSLDKTLLHLFLEDPSYLERIQKYPSMIQTEIIRTTFEIACEEFKNKGKRYDIGAVIDSLPDDYAPQIRSIFDEIAIDSDRREQVYQECLESWKKTGLAKREEEILSILSMADEESNADTIRQLSAELIRIQKEKGK